MPQFTGTFKGVNFSKAAYEAALRKRLREELIKAANAWFDIVVSIVPVWTGEAQGSLGPLASKIGRFVPVKIRDSSATARENRVAQGRTQGRGELKIDGFRAAMLWDSTVPHFIFNEQNNAENIGLRLRYPTPWQARSTAEIAFFRQVVKSFPARMVNPLDFFRPRTAKVNG